MAFRGVAEATGSVRRAIATCAGTRSTGDALVEKGIEGRPQACRLRTVKSRKRSSQPTKGG